MGLGTAPGRRQKEGVLGSGQGMGQGGAQGNEWVGPRVERAKGWPDPGRTSKQTADRSSTIYLHRGGLIAKPDYSSLDPIPFRRDRPLRPLPLLLDCLPPLGAGAAYLYAEPFCLLTANRRVVGDGAAQYG